MYKKLVSNLFRVTSAALVGALLASNFQLSTFNFQLNKPVYAVDGSGPDLSLNNYSVANESNPGAGYQTSVTAAVGDFLDVYMEAQNKNVPSDASNLVVKSYFPNFQGGAITTTGNVSTTTTCSTAGCKTSDTKTATINVPAAARLVYQPGSARVTADLNQDGTNELNGSVLSDNVVMSPDGTNLGTFKGGSATVQISYKIAVVSAANPNLTVRFLTKNTSKSGVDWAPSVSASKDETVKFYVELHNTQIGSSAKNVKIKATIPADFATSANVKLDVTADNAAAVSGNATVNFANASKLTYVNGSTLVVWDVNGDGNREYNNSVWPNNDIVGNGIVLTQDLNGTNEFIFQLIFSTTVSEQTNNVVTNPNCSLTKKIKLPNGNEVTSVDAGTHVYVSGEEIIYRLFVKNTGNGDADPVSISDFLPPYLYWISGDGGYASAENKVNFDLGTLKANEDKTITYKVKVREAIPSGQVTQQNNAKITSPSSLTCTSQSTLVIGKPGSVLAAAALPQTGNVPPSVLATFGLVATGLVLRLRKFKTSRYGTK